MAPKELLVCQFSWWNGNSTEMVIRPDDILWAYQRL